ncbi:MAG: hypothetical protein OQK94_03035 [Gammaproteobacteria bacterium]|nr:hypothetical protein [Gammaproteobacteria bacterium]MCW8840509.1 hypothetical protein [Gammaproteobacteria bacterium]MCW8927895.1 hypothetical protein [Gammaproteobacteria bacterium]MCW8958671.1 hypothetical protein [Gammaproteobacteria bacterium]MCW8973085.1 hypothetical protein [Gammaproteobacteria bacterium]
MATFMLHFDCRANGAGDERVTADVCVVSDTLELAEAIAREAVQDRAHETGTLIAYSTLDKSRIAALDGDEALLYLKALQHKPSVAVMFS